MTHKLDSKFKVAEKRYHDTQLDCVWEAVHKVCNVPPSTIEDKCRVQHFANSRFYFFYFARTRTNATWKHIGLYAGGRDHSTVIHGFQQLANWLDYDKDVQRKVAAIEQVLDGRITEGEEFYSRDKKLHYGFL